MSTFLNKKTNNKNKVNDFNILKKPELQHLKKIKISKYQIEFQHFSFVHKFKMSKFNFQYFKFSLLL